jgi:predicted phosphate transport protein (TIGR00153 family)
VIFGRLMPQEGNFFELFNQHAELIVRASRAFMDLIHNYQDASQRQQHADAVVTAERQADKITAEVNRLLHKTFITPIDREQIHGLINALDDVADLLQDATETLSLYDVRAVTEPLVRLGELGAKCCERTAHAVSLLPQVKDHAALEGMLKTCQEIDLLESDADRVMRAAMSQLFREEEDVRELIKLKAVYEQLEAITDRCQDVANLIEGIVLENS